jgi:2'-5' RNA ligase
MKKNHNEKFVRELKEVKAKLPKRYLGAIELLYPGKFKSRNVYNVIHYGIENYEILNALKAVVKKIERNKKLIA